MKKTINGKRYNTINCEELGIKEYYSNGTYSGETTLLRAPDGQLLVWTDGNGQDLYLQDNLELFEESEFTIDDFDLDNNQEKRLAALGLLQIIE